MKSPVRSLVLFSMMALCVPATYAKLTITPTFARSIKRLKSAATIEATIDQAILNLEDAISTPITVTIDFKYLGSGLGGSETASGPLAYSAYLADLKSNPHKSADDVTALAHLPAGPNTGINGNTDVVLSAALFAALGDTSEADSLVSENGGFDCTIFLNLRIMNRSRSGKQNPWYYDLESVAAHEMDEALGIGGEGSALYEAGSRAPRLLPTDGIGPLDLFRYSAPGVRSFTYNSNATAYFSIDGGTKDLTSFNQDGRYGADFGDWGGAAPGEGSDPPQVQDAYGTPGAEPDLGPNELAALDVIGYTLTSTPASVSQASLIESQTFVTPQIPLPEPRTYASLLIGGLFLLGIHRRRNAV